ncbi:MAG: aminotransferase class III-fold pyridoxal phosphate-dependent enzyme [Candidatus Promineifilaceae bacterium]|nr:aminotransferase class III-fold pyridoxal phosphate-dependent enzyme [Candidatus Promineifilaceae bacterium]
MANSDRSRSLQPSGQRFLSPAWYYTAPLSIVRGEGAYLIAENEERYLDFASGYGVTSTGHCHPRVVRAAQEQAASLIHVSTTVFNTRLLELAERLSAVTAPGLEMMFFHSAGAEAIEAAIKLSRRVTGRRQLIAFQGAFHGRTTGALALTTSKALYRQGHDPFIPGVHFAPYATPYRCPAGGSRDGCAAACLSELDRLFAHEVDPSQVAAIFIEPILGEGGYIDPPPAFLQGVRERCNRHGMLLVADEIQSGVGRSGKWWAIEHAGVVPDLMTVAKGIASGFPLSALIGRADVMSQWPPGAHGTTFGGNPVSCAAALATLDVIEDEGLVENAAARGRQLQDGLRQIQADHPVVGDVRGKGLMVGVEFVGPDAAPNPDAAAAVKDHCLQSGILISRCGPHNQTLRLAPPLIITDGEIDRFLRDFHRAVVSLAPVGEASP